MKMRNDTWVGAGGDLDVRHRKDVRAVEPRGERSKSPFAIPSSQMQRLGETVLHLPQVFWSPHKEETRSFFVVLLSKSVNAWCASDTTTRLSQP